MERLFLRQEKKTSLLPLPCEGGVDACLLTSIGILDFISIQDAT